MTYGARVRDASGVIILEETDRIARLVGSFNTGTGGGSLGFDNGGGQLTYAPMGTYDNYQDWPSISVGASSISWSASTASIFILVFAF